jgi:hypothetical protein
MDSPSSWSPAEHFRFLLHATAALPLLLFGVVELIRGWRPLFDNAAIALRSYQVFSGQSPLVGHQIAAAVDGQAVFSPGPVQNWLLAIPTRIDTVHGPLWGSVLVAVIAVVLAVEAGWGAARWWGATAVTMSVLVAYAVRGDLMINVMWNAWFAIIFLYPVLASGWAVASGRLRWWPITVIASTVVVQCQEVFAAPAIAVCVISVAVGVYVRWKSCEGSSLRPVVVGATVGVALWLPPAIQQLTGKPGNLTLLWRAASERGGKVGLSNALGALGSSVRPLPQWLHGPALGARGVTIYIIGIFAGPKWWAILALVLLAVTAALAWRSHRNVMAGGALVALSAALGTLLAVASVPAAQVLAFGYLGVLLIPVGTAVLLMLGWGGVEAVRFLIRRATDSRGGLIVRHDSGPGMTYQVLGLFATVGIALAISLSRGAAEVGGFPATLAGWDAVRATDQGVAKVANIAPHRAFRMELLGSLGPHDLYILTGMAYQLDAKGFDVRLPLAAAAPTFGAYSPSMPTVYVKVSAPDKIIGVELRPPTA